MTDWRADMVGATSEVVTAQARPVVATVRLLRLCWRLLPEVERRAFLGALDDNLTYQSVKQRSRADQDDRDLAEIIKRWELVLPSLSDETAAFGRSILGHRKKADWWPTEKQAAFMKSLWKDRLIVEGELEVTE